VAAAISSQPAGSFPTYGTGFVVGKMMQADVALEHDDAELRGDGSVAESEKGLLGGKITLGINDLTLEVERSMLGAQLKTVEGVSVNRDAAAYNPPFVGFGYYRVRKISGVTVIRAIWYYKTQWMQPTESAKQKDKKIEWQTPTIEGSIYLLDDADETMRDYVEFTGSTAEADAVAWLDEKANIGEPADLTDLNVAIAAAEELDSENYTALSWVALANALADAQAVAAMTSPTQTRVDSAENTLTAAVEALVLLTVATPIAVPGAGEVASGTLITLACATSGATIYYTTDGSDPNEEDTEYSAPIEITAPVTIKAIAVKSPLTDSGILSAAYTLPA
jgi:phi13 family phage major tail protein